MFSACKSRLTDIPERISETDFCFDSVALRVAFITRAALWLNRSSTAVSTSYAYSINLRSAICFAKSYLVANMDVELVKVHSKVDFVLLALRIHSEKTMECSHLPCPRPPCFSATTAKQRFNLDKRLSGHGQSYLGQASAWLFLWLPFLD